MSSGISVIIPSCNGERFLAEALESVFSQTLQPREIVVVDDASADGTVALARKMADWGPVPMRVICLDSNSGGPAMPLNVGIEAAQGELIALLDQDDVLCPENFATKGEVLREHPEVDLALGDYESFGSEGAVPATDARHIAPGSHGDFVREAGGVHIVDPLTCIRGFIRYNGLPRGCSNMFFRKTFWERAGGFDPAAGACADYDFVLRTIDTPVAWIDRPLFRRRLHENHTWKPTTENYLITLRIQRKAACRFPECRELGKLAAEAAESLTRQFRWMECHAASLAAARELFRQRRWAAGRECLKTIAAFARDQLFPTRK